MCVFGQLLLTLLLFQGDQVKGYSNFSFCHKFRQVVSKNILIDYFSMYQIPCSIEANFLFCIM